MRDLSHFAFGIAGLAVVTPVRASATLAHDPDDPAIWVHPTAPERSLVLGTVKVEAPDGGVAVFALDGSLKQLVTGIDRPNNIDVEYGFAFGGRTIDIAVVTERYQRRLGPDFPGGLFVAMNSRARNFLLYRWSDIEAAIDGKRIKER